jgi:hypothetical protein
MKNKPIVVSNSPGKKNTSKRRVEKTEPSFKQLATDAGLSKEAVNELIKWYSNSK